MLHSIMDVDPVTICDISDEAKVRERIAEALTRSNQVVPTPQPTDEPGSAVLEKLNLRKWRKFEAEAVMFTIYMNESGIEYYSTGEAQSGEWKMRGGKHISFSADTDHTRVVDIIVQELNEKTSDEAGKVGGLMLLPPPEPDL